MKKRKTAAYALAALLLVGGTFTGTKAWFSDKVTTDNGIKITMGTLDLTLEENKSGEGESVTTVEGWKLVRGTQDNESTTDNKSTDIVEGRNEETGTAFTQIRPGDRFTRTITLTNTGKLDQMVKIESKLADLSTYKNLFDLTVTGDDGYFKANDSVRLNAKEEKTVTLSLYANPEKINNLDANTSNHNREFSFAELSAITITGTQINANGVTSTNGIPVE